MSDDDGKHLCGTEGCNRRCGRHDVICSRCMAAVANMCKGKQRVNPYVARKRAEKTRRGWYRCLVCSRNHNTRTLPGPGAHTNRARVEHAVKALTSSRGKAWYAQLVESWDPVNSQRRHPSRRKAGARPAAKPVETNAERTTPRIVSHPPAAMGVFLSEGDRREVPGQQRCGTDNGWHALDSLMNTACDDDQRRRGQDQMITVS